LLPVYEHSRQWGHLGAPFSIGALTALPHSVQLPS
jgi:hypothetical protein